MCKAIAPQQWDVTRKANLTVFQFAGYRAKRGLNGLNPCLSGYQQADWNDMRSHKDMQSRSLLNHNVACILWISPLHIATGLQLYSQNRYQSPQLSISSSFDAVSSWWLPVNKHETSFIRFSLPGQPVGFNRLTTTWYCHCCDCDLHEQFAWRYVWFNCHQRPRA